MSTDAAPSHSIDAARASRRRLTILAFGSAASTHVVSRVRCFAERGHRVHLVSDVFKGIGGVDEIVPAALPETPAGRAMAAAERAIAAVIGKNPATFRLLATLMYRLRRLRPDIVHVHYAYGGWAWFAALLGLHPLVVSTMGGDILFDEQGAPTPRGRRLTLALLEAADLVTAKSDRLVTVLRDLGGFDGKAMKVVWGVDPDRFRCRDATALRLELNLPPQAQVVLSPKILQPFYNIDRIVEAMPAILRACPQAWLIVTGYHADPDYRQALLARAQALGVGPRVLFVGAVAHERMAEYYSLARVAVAVPPSDGLPQALLEAMACGVPSVLADIPAYREFVEHGRSGWLVSPEPEAIARGVAAILGDPALHGRIAEAGRAFVAAKADFRAEVDKVEDAYYALLARPKRRRAVLSRLRAGADLLLHFTGFPG
ncbi:MAG: glycosyltransferase family 4 protein [Gammaproteobacteria bacterium]